MAAQVGLCLAWSETPEDRFCRVVAHVILKICFFALSSLFILSFLKPMNWALYTSSVLVGFGAASKCLSSTTLWYFKAVVFF